jgi:hypothetical protein
MKVVTTHQINPANKAILINTGVEPHPVSNAYTDYHLLFGAPEAKEALILRFQNGPVDHDGNGVNGITHEALLAVLIDRLTDFQTGPYACEENKLALDSLVAARSALHSRTLLRQARGVEGQHIV